MANTLEELPLYTYVLEFWDAVHAILQTPKLRNDYKLAKQIADANDSVDANMKEGFEQPSDAAFANFVFTAKGSVAEAIARMKSARRKQHITDEQLAKVIELGEPLGKMMGDRGRHSVAPTPRRPTKPHH